MLTKPRGLPFIENTAGGVLQLQAYGIQDAYITTNPSITFFKVVYRRHTNFAMESMEQTFNGTVDFGRKVSCTIARNADLMHKVYLQVSTPALTASSGNIRWVDNLGHVLIDEVTLSIGGQQIDKHYGDWLTIWNELTQTAEKEEGYQTMIGGGTDMVTADTTIAANTIYVPLQFWFCKNPGLALPLVALQYHEVKIDITFKSAASCYIGAIATTPSLVNASLWVNYVFLDGDERKQFAQASHEYLIEQLQYTGSETITSTASKNKLALNHPVKELIWVLQPESNIASKLWSTFSLTSGAHPLVDAKLVLNGNDRFSTRLASYFNLVQPYEAHTRIPDTGIYVYSFALEPEQHQPSGSCNMSRIDNPTLNMTLDSSVTSDNLSFRMYAVNYNVLRIKSGMGGLQFSA